MSADQIAPPPVPPAPRKSHPRTPRSLLPRGPHAPPPGAARHATHPPSLPYSVTPPPRLTRNPSAEPPPEPPPSHASHARSHPRSHAGATESRLGAVKTKFPAQTVISVTPPRLATGNRSGRPGAGEWGAAARRDPERSGGSVRCSGVAGGCGVRFDPVRSAGVGEWRSTGVGRWRRSLPVAVLIVPADNWLRATANCQRRRAGRGGWSRAYARRNIALKSARLSARVLQTACTRELPG
jgi:hypothetical protein